MIGELSHKLFHAVHVIIPVQPSIFALHVYFLNSLLMKIVMNLHEDSIDFLTSPV